MISYSIKHFNELSPQEVYHIIQQRIAVFIIEQNCPYQECDDKDLNAYHVMGKDENGVIQSYCRLLDKGVSYEKYSSIGRVITTEACRGTGEGKRLMSYAIEQIKIKYPNNSVKIGAQCYAIPFYEKLGFNPVGDEYQEDGIPHISMVLEIFISQ